MEELNFEICKEIALKYYRKIDFRKFDYTTFNYANSNGFLNDICTHMQSMQDIKNKCVYVYEFPDNHAYVGITNKLRRRNLERKRRESDSVTKHINETGLEPKLIQLIDYISYEESQKLEEYYVDLYKSNGWNILNVAKPGALGGNVIFWTKENCYNEALKYETKADFRKYSSSAYVIAKNNKWIDDICTHMRQLKKDGGYWNKNKCRETALQYDDYTTFAKENQSCYTAIHRNGWENELCSHILHTKIKPNGYWNYNTCVDAVSQCSSKKEFSDKFQGGYTYARKNGFLQDITKHLEKQKFELTFDEAKEICKNYKNISDLERNNSKIYKYCFKNQWLRELFPKIVYDYEYCKQYCSKFENRTQLRNHSKIIFEVCTTNNWLDEFYGEIYLNTNTIEFKNKCLETSKKCNSRTDFRNFYEFMYRKSIKYGWIDEFFPIEKLIWDYEKCKEYCKKFKKRSELHDTNRYLYDFIRDNGWLDEFLPKVKPNSNDK